MQQVTPSTASDTSHPSIAVTPTTIICPLNGSEDAERALHTAGDVAAHFGADLLLFSAVEDAHELADREAYLRLHEIAGRAKNPAVATDILAVVNPNAPDAIRELTTPKNMVVMATSGQPLIHHGYLGSAAERIIRDGQLPTVLVGPHVDAARGLDATKIIVPVDGSTISESALVEAHAWAERLDVPLWVMTVVTPEQMRKAQKVLGAEFAEDETGYVRNLAKPLDAQWEVLHAPDPAEAIAEAAGDDGIVVMSTHGRSGLRRLALGSVATKVVRYATAPVIVTKGD